MRRMAARITAVLIASLGLSLGLSLAQQDQKAQPEQAKAPVMVTYYYLPG